MKAAVVYENGGPEVNGETRPLVRRPHIIGYQCAGTTVEVGTDVTDRRVGQRVVAILSLGSHAQLAVATAKDTWVLSAGIDSNFAAAVPVAWVTAHECLFAFGQLAAGLERLSEHGVHLPRSLDLEHERVHVLVDSLLTGVARGELQAVIDGVSH